MSDQGLTTCEQLEERLSDWLDHDVDPATRPMLERHLAACARCTALVADVSSIRREAASLPELVPSRDLWPEIEARIQAPVISLDQPRVPRAVSGRRVVRRTWWLGAAAAGLVAVTAGVTYYMTVERTPPSTVTAVEPAVVRTPETAPPPPEVTEPEATLASMEPRSTPRDARPATTAPPGATAVEGSEYSRDVAQLRAIVTQRRTEFDSTTIAVLEKNLDLIDRAIAESRAALRSDPASEFLADQLARAMTKKVAILRTAALLPSRS